MRKSGLKKNRNSRRQKRNRSWFKRVLSNPLRYYLLYRMSHPNRSTPLRIATASPLRAETVSNPLLKYATGYAKSINKQLGTVMKGISHIKNSPKRGRVRKGKKSAIESNYVLRSRRINHTPASTESDIEDADILIPSEEVKSKVKDD